MNMKVGVIVFPGTNCDRDIAYVTQQLLGQPTRRVWHQETDISDLDVVVVPGGLVTETTCAVGRSLNFRLSCGR